MKLTRRSSPPVERSHQRMGAGLAASSDAAVAGRSFASVDRERARLRSKLLLVPWQHARRGNSESRVRFHFRLRKRLRSSKSRKPPLGVLTLRAWALLVAESEPGICRVICFSPRHDLTLATMLLDQIELVVHTWAGQFRELGDVASIQSCTDLRKPRRHDGRQQSASSLPRSGRRLQFQKRRPRNSQLRAPTACRTIAVSSVIMLP